MSIYKVTVTVEVEALNDYSAALRIGKAILAVDGMRHYEARTEEGTILSFVRG